MVKSSLCDYSDSYLLIEGRITIIGEGDNATIRQTDERNKGVIFKNGASFINYKSEINNTEINNAKDTDIIMLLYNLIEYTDNYSKTSPILWQYYKHEPNNNLTDSESFKCKLKIAGNTPADGNKIFKQFLENSIEMPLINWEANAILTWLSTSAVARRFVLTDAKLCVAVVNLSISDNGKLLQQLKSGFKGTINWNKYQSNPKNIAQNRYLNHLVDPNFQELNRLFVLSFEKEDYWTSHSEYYLAKVEIKNYNVMVNGKRFFEQPINNDSKTY